MTMSSASESQSAQPKRKRVDQTVAPLSETATTSSTLTKKKAPKAIASAILAGHLEMLLPTLAPILSDLGKNFLDLLHRRHNKRRQLDRMTADEEIIPRFTRIEFKLSALSRVTERPDFITLQEETSSLVSDFKLQLKKQIVAAIRIEVLALADEINIF